ncbi:MAG TPA: imidazole glycerol phosphate synthase subunit HisH [Rhizomicrobium sp.]|jgi:glutamine amidotransferase|nr:imidazole glycerol phosphate synthase subunit HisH [Rhizomicrobium sp.]
MTVAIVDSGVANLASVLAALRRLGAEARVTCDDETIRAADHVILPGVGSAAAAMARLQANDLIHLLRQLTRPVLGICLGMQLLFEFSEENGGTRGLGIVPGKVRRLRSSPATPVPHMGWNQLIVRHPEHRMLRDVQGGSFVYFVHGFAAPPAETALATTQYGEAFAAIVEWKNFLGCQFHPERSGTVGAQVLKNFLCM